ncbi:MAG: DUF692 family multinuclear iron-containing protein, partial [Candidatus Omnitrophota bacterium]
MVRMATPVSSLFAEGQQLLEIRRLSDCLEGRDHTCQLAIEDQRLFHFEMSIVNAWGEAERAWAKGVIEGRPALEGVSFHMASCCSHPVIESGVFQPGGKAFTRVELLEHARCNILWLKGVNKGRAVRIAVENNNYFLTPAYAHVAEPSFIASVVRDNGIHFLFDVAHAHISAHNMRMSYDTYV